MYTTNITKVYKSINENRTIYIKREKKHTDSVRESRGGKTEVYNNKENVGIQL